MLDVGMNREEQIETQGHQTAQQPTKFIKLVPPLLLISTSVLIQYISLVMFLIIAH